MNPRNDQAILDSLAKAREDSENAYADAHIRADKVSRPFRYQDERCPDGRNIYRDHCGYYTAIQNNISPKKGHRK